MINKKKKIVYSLKIFIVFLVNVFIAVIFFDKLKKKKN